MLSFRFTIVGLFVLTCSTLTHGDDEQSVSCLDDDGKPVDWYVAYKFPIIKNQGELLDTGLAYVYFTSDHVNQVEPLAKSLPEETDTKGVVFLNQFRRLLFKYIGFPMTSKRIQRRAPKSQRKEELKWTLSSKSITDPQSLVLRTLAVAYENKKPRDENNINVIFYNDHPPNVGDKPKSRNQQKAHAKGAVIIDDKTGYGIWLTHSVPKFPSRHIEELRFDANIGVNGQTFMCISFDVKRSGKQIVDHLVNMFPQVYDHFISKKMYEILPELSGFRFHTPGARHRAMEPKLSQVITTRAGQDMHLYSKSRDFTNDIYSEWIDHELETTLLVETWRTGRGGVLNSSCPRDDYHVNNVRDLKYDGGDLHFSWIYEKDHSKWAISDNEQTSVICISDINRMQSQFKRGGGAVCLRCPSCWKVFSNTILDLEPCPINPKPAEKTPSLDHELIQRLKSWFA